MFSIATLAAVVGLALFPGATWANGDLDAAMNGVLSQYKIRGGAVAFYDKVSVRSMPMTRVYENVV